MVRLVRVTQAAEWLYDYYWSDVKCHAACEGQLTSEGLAHEEEIINGVFTDGSPNIETRTVYEWTAPRLAEVVLHWRVRDAFGFVTWDRFSSEARAAFEAFMLANEVSKGYVFAKSCKPESGS